MSDTGYSATPLAGGVGSEIAGLDIQSEIPDQTAAELRALWLEHGMLFFRGMGTSPEVQLHLSRCFGDLEAHPIPKFRHPDWPELILLTNQDGPTSPVYDFGDGTAIHGRIPWHIDLAFKTTPNAGALLRMVRKTKDGGQTGWLDAAKAYDTLPDATKARIDNLEAVYLFRAGLEEMRFSAPEGVRLDARKDSYPHFPPVANPLVWNHPATGRRVLNLSLLNIDGVLGLARADGDALIEELVAHIADPAFSYVHQWQENDMVLWDNRRMMHCTLGHPVDQVRVVHRTTIAGSVAMGRELASSELEEMA